MARTLAAAAAIAVALAAGVTSAGPHAAGSQTPTPPPGPRAGARHSVPLHGSLLRHFDAPPDDPYAPGHRGTDVGAEPGTPVRASADGTVTFAGNVAGNLTATVDHGDGIRTTYSFLADLFVRTGEPVERGHVLGTVGDGHPGAGLPPHVHLSARRGERYFDPLELYVGDDHSDLLSIVS